MKRRTLLKSALVAPLLVRAAAPSGNLATETKKATRTGEAETADGTRQPWSRGIQCGTGWQRLYAPVIQQCSAEGVPVFVVKEKFGGLRIQIGRNQTRPSDFLEHAIARAEDLSFSVCEVCGMPGLLGGVGGEPGTHGAAMRTRCDAHENIESIDPVDHGKTDGAVVGEKRVRSGRTVLPGNG